MASWIKAGPRRIRSYFQAGSLLSRYFLAWTFTKCEEQRNRVLGYTGYIGYAGYIGHRGYVGYIGYVGSRL